jgi:general secretion pathway protein D
LFKNGTSGGSSNSSNSRMMSFGPGGPAGPGGMRFGPGGQQNGSGGGTGNASNDANASAGVGGSARASSDDYSNSVIVTGPPAQLTQIEQVIQQIDQPVGSKLITQIFPIRYTDATELSTVVSGVLSATANGGVGSPGSQQQGGMPFEMRAMMRGGSTGSGGNQVVTSAETNSIIVTATETQLDLIQKVLGELDQPKKMVGTTYVRTLNNASASDIAQLLTSMFGNKTNTSSTSSSNSRNGSRTSTSGFGNSSGFGNNNGFGNNGGFGNNRGGGFGGGGFGG